MEENHTKKDEIQNRYKFTDLDKESEFFSGEMSENLTEFGTDGQYHVVDFGRLTKLGKIAFDEAKDQLKKWLFLDPYKLRRFIQLNCPWSIIDQHLIEQKTEALMQNLWDDQKLLEPLAQIMIRLSENSRTRYLAVAQLSNLNQKWFGENLHSYKSDQSWDLNFPVLSAMAQNTQMLLDSIGCGNLPIWAYVAENLASIMKILALFAIQQEKADRILKTMTNMRKSMVAIQTMIQKDLNRKTVKNSSVSSQDETNSPLITPRNSGGNLQNFPINSDKKENIIILSRKIQDYNIFINNKMSGGKETRPELRPDDYLKNFQALCQNAGLANLTEPLFKVLRECYTNPLAYLGPPKNLPTDLSCLSQPLTVSKESWKARRIHSLEQKTCARCGQKGHTPVNCTGSILCTHCGKEGHAAKGCKNEPMKIEKKDVSEDKKSSEKNRLKASSSRKRKTKNKSDNSH